MHYLRCILVSHCIYLSCTLTLPPFSLVLYQYNTDIHYSSFRLGTWKFWTFRPYFICKIEWTTTISTTSLLSLTSGCSLGAGIHDSEFVFRRADWRPAHRQRCNCKHESRSQCIKVSAPTSVYQRRTNPLYRLKFSRKIFHTKEIHLESSQEMPLNALPFGKYDKIESLQRRKPWCALLQFQHSMHFDDETTKPNISFAVF